MSRRDSTLTVTAAEATQAWIAADPGRRFHDPVIEEADGFSVLYVDTMKNPCSFISTGVSEEEAMRNALGLATGKIKGVLIQL